MRALVDTIAKENLTVNFEKGTFCHDNAKYSGHKVSQSYVTSILAKVEAIAQFPIPILQTRKSY